ncbi:MAG: hypothetical protein E7672_05625 [Ruminococcaceae bacterium]|nr:hypothetical protein [Oscillospiraceae bacterium]
MKNKEMIRNISVAGIFAALAIAFMYIGGLTMLDLSVLVVCSLMTMILVVETNVRMAWIYAAVTSVLALILMPSKLYAIEYVMFSALYPILKLYVERISPIPAFIVKISILDTMLLSSIVLAQKVFLLGDEWFSLNLITILLGTVFFVVYDLCISTFITFYMVKLRKRLGIKKHL